MITMRRSLPALLLIATSCARPPAATATGTQLARNPNVISQAELQNPELGGMDALKAIRFLRPTFFRTSGPQSFVGGGAGIVQFSEDYGPLRPIRELTYFRVNLLYEVRYLDEHDAQNRFGLNANGGPVIVLVSFKQQ